MAFMTTNGRSVTVRRVIAEDYGGVLLIAHRGFDDEFGL